MCVCVTQEAMAKLKEDLGDAAGDDDEERAEKKKEKKDKVSSVCVCVGGFPYVCAFSNVYSCFACTHVWPVCAWCLDQSVNTAVIQAGEAKV